MDENSKKEFMEKWRIIFEQDCKVNVGGKFTASSIHRTITETEVIRIGEHLFEWFNSYKLERSADYLARVLMKTQGRFQSCQDWAEDIIRRMNAS